MIIISRDCLEIYDYWFTPRLATILQRLKGVANLNYFVNDIRVISIFCLLRKTYLTGNGIIQKLFVVLRYFKSNDIFDYSSNDIFGITVVGMKAFYWLYKCNGNTQQRHFLSTKALFSIKIYYYI